MENEGDLRVGRRGRVRGWEKRRKGKGGKVDGLRVEKGEGLEVGKEGRVRGGKRGKG